MSQTSTGETAMVPAETERRNPILTPRLDGLRRGLMLAAALMLIANRNASIGARAADRLAPLDLRTLAGRQLGYRVGRRLAQWLARGGRR